MRKVLGFILGMTILAGILQLSIQMDAFAKKTSYESNENVIDINNKENASKVNEALDVNNGENSSKVSEVLNVNNDVCSGSSQPVTVLNQSENRWVAIRQTPSTRSKIIGRVYGNLTGVKVLQIKSGYAYIEAVDYNSGKKVRGYVGQAMIKKRMPQRPYYVVADISEQKIHVYKDGLKIKEMLCSTGRENAATPTGTYLIGGRGKSFYSSKYKQGGYNWVRFNNNFLFHSVPFDSRGRIIAAEEKKLGQRVSHGCIRLSIGDSKWFYSAIPAGTAVIVQE